MEAHTGAVTFPREWAQSPRRPRLAAIREAITQRRAASAERAHSMRQSASPRYSVPGSEHSHLLRRPRGF
jgi:hypothetical protein